MTSAVATYETPRLFVPAVRSIVRFYVVVLALFMAGILVPALGFFR